MTGFVVRSIPFSSSFPFSFLIFSSFPFLPFSSLLFFFSFLIFSSFPFLLLLFLPSFHLFLHFFFFFSFLIPPFPVFSFLVSPNERPRSVPPVPQILTISQMPKFVAFVDWKVRLANHFSILAFAPVPFVSFTKNGKFSVYFLLFLISVYLLSSVYF